MAGSIKFQFSWLLALCPWPCWLASSLSKDNHSPHHGVVEGGVEVICKVLGPASGTWCAPIKGWPVIDERPLLGPGQPRLSGCCCGSPHLACSSLFLVPCARSPGQRIRQSWTPSSRSCCTSRLWPTSPTRSASDSSPHLAPSPKPPFL